MRKLMRSLGVAKRRYTELPNVIGMGVGYKKQSQNDVDEPAVVFFVDKKVPSDALGVDELIPKRVGRHCTDVIEVGDVRLLGRMERQRPAAPGSSIGHFKVSAGTFGAVVRDRESGELFILSNNHVLADSSDGIDGRARPGDHIYQPGVHDGGSEKDLIGYLERFEPIQKYSANTDCRVAAMGVLAANVVIHAFRPNYRMRLEKLGAANTVDCALARPVDPQDIIPEIMEFGRVKGIMDAELGMLVKKSGRTSGVTEGRITAIHVTLNISMGHSEVVRFNDQIMTEMQSLPGDSGSLVLEQGNNAVGLLFAGSNKFSVINPIRTVLDRMNVDLV